LRPSEAALICRCSVSKAALMSSTKGRNFAEVSLIFFQSLFITVMLLRWFTQSRFIIHDRDLCKTSNFVEIAEGENLTRRNMFNISRA